MTIKQLFPAGVILAANLAGSAGAQERIIMWTPDLPPPREVAPASSAACCPRPPHYHAFWHRAKSCLEKWCVSSEPDPLPLGQSVYNTMMTQVDIGIASRLILHDFDFVPGGASLNYRGQQTLQQVATLALRHPYRVVVERTNYQPPLAEMRRQEVLKELVRQGIPLPADRVIVGYPITPGLAGVEAQYLYQNLINQTMQGPMSAGSNGGAGGTGSGASTSGSTPISPQSPR